MEEFVHYCKDKITCKVLAFLGTEHENEKIFAVVSLSLLS